MIQDQEQQDAHNAGQDLNNADWILHLVPLFQLLDPEYQDLIMIPMESGGNGVMQVITTKKQKHVIQFVKMDA